MKYKGTHVHTINDQDLTHNKGSWWMKLSSTMGRILPCDVGKQVYEYGCCYHVENDEQLKARTSEEA